MLIQLTLLQFYEPLFIFLISLFHMDKITFEKKWFFLENSCHVQIAKKASYKNPFFTSLKKVHKSEISQCLDY